MVVLVIIIGSFLIFFFYEAITTYKLKYYATKKSIHKTVFEICSGQKTFYLNNQAPVQERHFSIGFK